MSHPQALLLETMKKAAAILQQAGIPFALAGGAAAYARGAAPPAHDVDFVILAEDVDATAIAFSNAGMTVERLPEEWLIKAFAEHHADFALALTIVRPMREQADWGEVRAAVEGSAFARAFLVLLEELAVIDAVPENDNLAGRLEHALATDPRTHELGVRVDVTAGVASLRGEVAGKQRRALLAEVASEVLSKVASGVMLRNEVTLTEVRAP
jgi:hypothetical protein